MRKVTESARSNPNHHAAPEKAKQHGDSFIPDFDSFVRDHSGGRGRQTNNWIDVPETEIVESANVDGSRDIFKASPLLSGTMTVLTVCMLMRGE
jgi:hypothetical protein